MSLIKLKSIFDILILSLIILLVSVMGGIGFDFAAGSKMVSLHSMRNILTAAILFWFIRISADKENRFIKTGFDLPVLIYLITFVFAIIFSSQPKVSILYFRDFILCIGMAYLLINNINNKNKLKAIFLILLISVIYTAARGNFQYFQFIIQYVNGKFQYIKTHRGENFKDYYSFIGRAEFGAVTLFAMPVLTGFFLNCKKKLAFSGFFITGLTILFTGLMVSYSRGSWIGLLAIFLFFNFLNKNLLKNWKFILLNILVVVFLFLVLSNSVWIKKRIISLTEFTRGSAGNRISIWKSSLKMIEDFPFFGTGPGTYDAVYLQYKRPDASGDYGKGMHAHNIFLHIASENGMIGLFGFLAVIIVTFKKYYEIRNIMDDKELKNLLDAAILGLVGYLACSQTTIFFANHNKNEKISMFLWFDIALIFIIENIAKKQNEFEKTDSH